MEIILGVLATALTQWLKKYGKNQWHTLAILAVISLALAGVYVTLISTGYWQTVGTVIVISGAIYTFIIQRFEK